VLQKTAVLLAKAGYLALIQLLLLPLDCSSSGDVYTLDAYPTVTCWDHWGHWLNAIAAVVVASVYTVVVARVVLAGGNLANIEFHLLRFWDRSQDRVQSQVINHDCVWCSCRSDGSRLPLTCSRCDLTPSSLCTH